MKIYFVHSYNFEDILREKHVPIIVSYARLRRLEVPKGFLEIMVDSGGYQLQRDTGVRDIYLNAYAHWLNYTLPIHPEIKYYFNLDIWQNGEQTLENQMKMEEKGLHPLPIWHSGTPIEFLNYYCTHYDYIAIGGIANVRNKANLRSLCTWLFQTYPNTKFHLLGIGLSGIRTFKSFRPCSIDFSTWITPARFGHSIEPDEEDLLKEIVLSREIRDELRKDKELERKYISEAIDRIKNLEIDVEDFNEPYQKILF